MYHQCTCAFLISKWRQTEMYGKSIRKRCQIRDKGNGNTKNQKKPSSIMVQRMAPIPTGKQKKFEPERTRDFVDFTEYSTLSLKSVKQACEKFYGEPDGSCDVLFSDRGPSCISDDQIAGKKVILIRFLPETIMNNTGRKSENNTPPHLFLLFILIMNILKYQQQA